MSASHHSFFQQASQEITESIPPILYAFDNKKKNETIIVLGHHLDSNVVIGIRNSQQHVDSLKSWGYKIDMHTGCVTYVLQPNKYGYTSISYLSNEIYFTEAQTGARKLTAKPYSLNEKNYLHQLLTLSKLKKLATTPQNESALQLKKW